MKKQIKIEGMHCSHCSGRVVRAFEAKGIACEIDLAKGLAVVSGDDKKLDDAALRDAVESLGFDVVDIKQI
ncbi:MAG: heavy-metal-associated domain-containing protein [Clostridia bacterium]|nr:heavy-metal-associated domain-containing protein [Clostridia bacterium]